MAEQQAEQDRTEREKLLAEDLPVLREIFALFDADGDGILSKGEYKRYLRGIKFWGIGTCTDEMYDSEGWEAECKGMQCTTEEGISKNAFETILYGVHRLGKAQTDLANCKG